MVVIVQVTVMINGSGDDDDTIKIIAQTIVVAMLITKLSFTNMEAESVMITIITLIRFEKRVARNCILGVYNNFSI
jgi:hypothetical protein